jgi:hypothetical protein
MMLLVDGISGPSEWDPFFGYSYRSPVRPGLPEKRPKNDMSIFIRSLPFSVFADSNGNERAKPHRG